MARYLAIWHDESGLSRAWGAADEQDLAEAQADIEAEEYRKGRPDVTLVQRVTHEFLSDEVAIVVAEVAR